MGVVYRALDAELDRRVAIKQIRSLAGEESVERFLREARAVARLRHPGIVALHDIGRTEEGPFFTMELLEGESLDRRLGRGPLGARAAAEVGRQVALALQAAHDAGIVHRDVKPGNVFLLGPDRAILTDFGLAKELRDPAPELTASGAILGTPYYLSPEQAAGGSRRVGPASDQFSLGVVLYQAATGFVPFGGDGLGEILDGIARRDPVPPRALEPRIHVDFETIAMAALAKRPEDRYASCAELAADLERFVRGEPIRARAPGRAARAARWVRRRPGFALLAAACGLATAALALALFGPVRLAIGSEPAGAEVSIDGRTRGTTPLRLWVWPPGTIDVEFRRDGHVPVRRGVRLRPGLDERVDATLEPDHGWLRFAIEPATATVSIDGVPLGAPRGEATRCPRGRRLIEIQSAGHEPVSFAVDVRPGETAEVTRALAAATGRLTATSSSGQVSLELAGDGPGRRFEWTAPFEDRALPVGRYEVHATREGCFPRRAAIDVIPGATVDLDVTLSGRALWEVSTGGRPAQPARFLDADRDGLLDVLLAVEVEPAAGTILLAISGRTRETIWRRRLPGLPRHAPVVADLDLDGGDDVFLAAGAAGYALDGADGSSRWTIPLGGVVPADPALVETDLVLAIRRPGRDEVRAVSGRDGSTSWRVEIAHHRTGAGDDALEEGRLVVAADGTLLVTTAGQGLLALAPGGEVRWRHDDVLAASAPFLGAGQVFYAASGGTIVALDASTGRPRWKDTLPVHRIDRSLSADWDGDGVADWLVFASDSRADSKILVRSGTDGRPLGARQLLEPCLGRPAVLEGSPPSPLLPAAGGLLRLEGRTDEVLWRGPDAAPVLGIAVVDLDADGRLDALAGTSKGLLAAFRLEPPPPGWTIRGETAEDARYALRSAPGGGVLAALALDEIGLLDGASGRVVRRWSVDPRGELLFEAGTGAAAFLHAARGNRVVADDPAGRRLWERTFAERDPAGPTDGPVEWKDDLPGRRFAWRTIPSAAWTQPWLRTVVSIALGPGVALVSTLRGDLQAFDAGTGGPLWSHAARAPFRSPPVLLDLDGDGALEVLAASFDGVVHRLAASDGTLAWSRDLEVPLRAAPADAGDLDGDRTRDLVVGSFVGSVHALSGADGHVLWSAASDSAAIASPAIVFETPGERLVAWTDTEGGLRAWSAATGRPAWRFEPRHADGASYAVAPSRAGGPVLVLCHPRTLHVLDPADGRERSRLVLPGEPTARPVLLETEGGTDLVVALQGAVVAKLPLAQPAVRSWTWSGDHDEARARLDGEALHGRLAARAALEDGRWSELLELSRSSPALQGTALAMLGRGDEARPLLEAAFARGESEPAALVELWRTTRSAMVARRLLEVHPEEALRRLGEGERRDPSFVEALAGASPRPPGARALVLAQSGRGAEAALDLERARDVGEPGASALARAVLVHALRRDPLQAALAWRALVQTGGADRFRWVRDWLDEPTTRELDRVDADRLVEILRHPMSNADELESFARLGPAFARLSLPLAQAHRSAGRFEPARLELDRYEAACPDAPLGPVERARLRAAPGARARAPGAWPRPGTGRGAWWPSAGRDGSASRTRRRSGSIRPSRRSGRTRRSAPSSSGAESDSVSAIHAARDRRSLRDRGERHKGRHGGTETRR